MYAFLNVKKKIKNSEWPRKMPTLGIHMQAHPYECVPHAHLCHMPKTGKYTYMHTHKVITCIDVLFYSHFIFNLFI